MKGDNLKAVFICSANSSVGYGHLSRSINFARILRDELKFKTIFLGNYSTQAKTQLVKQKFDQNEISSLDIIEVETALSSLPDVDLICTDSYEINQLYVDMICSRNSKSVFIDDFNTLILDKADLVINFRIEGLNYNYNSTHVGLGVEYFLAKRELMRVRKNASIDSSLKNKNILIFFSGISSEHWLVKESIGVINSNVTDVEITILANEEEKKHRVKSNNICVTPLTDKIETCLEKADMVISFGGFFKYESAFCNVPSAILSYNEGQRDDTESFLKNKLVFDLGYYPVVDMAKYCRSLKEFLTDEKLRKELRENCSRYFSDEPINQIANLINEL